MACAGRARAAAGVDADAGDDAGRCRCPWSRSDCDTAAADVLARGWLGDRFWVYGGTGTSAVATAMVWRIAFVDVGSATLAVQSLSSRFNVQRAGTEVVIAATDAAVPLDWAFAVPAQNAPAAAGDELQLRDRFVGERLAQSDLDAG